MAFDGNGTFNRVHNWVSDKTNGINITASEMDAEDNGFAAGLTLAVTRDGQGKPASHFDPASDAAYDLGNANSWRNLTLSGTATVGGKLSANGGVALTGDSSGRGIAVCRFKASATSLNSTAVLANDPDLQYAIANAGTYAFQAFLMVNAGAGGFRATMAYSGGTVTNGYYVSGALGGSAITLTGILTVNGGGFSNGSANAFDVVFIYGSLVATSAGTFSVQWAQSTGNAADTTVNAGSYMTVTQVS